MKFQANYSNGKFFTSSDHLNKLWLKKMICREIISERHGLQWSEYTYRFTTHYGVFLADVTKYSDHGFSSQAYGYEIPTNSLKNPKKEDISDKVKYTDRMIFRECLVIKNIAFKEGWKY